MLRLFVTYQYFYEYVRNPLTEFHFLRTFFSSQIWKKSRSAILCMYVYVEDYYEELLAFNWLVILFTIPFFTIMISYLKRTKLVAKSRLCNTIFLFMYKYIHKIWFLHKHELLPRLCVYTHIRTYIIKCLFCVYKMCGFCRLEDL